MDNQGWKVEVHKSDEPASFSQRFAGDIASQRSNVLKHEADPNRALALSTSLPEIELRDRMPLQQGNPSLAKVIVVDKSNHRTHVLQMGDDGKLQEVVNVPNAVGKNPNWTPEGKTHLISKEHMPSFTDPHSHRTIGPGINNPVGVLKMRTTFGGGNIMLHGTPPRWDDAIGSNASHGCIRHHNADILKIGAQVHKGDAVYIVKRFEGTRINAADFIR